MNPSVKLMMVKTKKRKKKKEKKSREGKGLVLCDLIKDEAFIPACACG